MNEYTFCQLRTEVNKVLEVARTGKLIGASLDAKVHIHTSDAIMASKLSELCTSEIDADTLNRLFITSQVRLKLQYFLVTKI
jgi:isoleucyl-tRNA synthetase